MQALLLIGPSGGTPKEVIRKALDHGAWLTASGQTGCRSLWEQLYDASGLCVQAGS